MRFLKPHFSRFSRASELILLPALWSDLYAKWAKVDRLCVLGKFSWSFPHFPSRTISVNSPFGWQYYYNYFRYLIYVPSECFMSTNGKSIRFDFSENAILLKLLFSKNFLWVYCIVILLCKYTESIIQLQFVCKKNNGFQNRVPHSTIKNIASMFNKLFTFRKIMYLVCLLCIYSTLLGRKYVIIFHVIFWLQKVKTK